MMPSPGPAARTSLQELFDRDPEGLTALDLEAMRDGLLTQRHIWAAETAAASTTGRRPRSSVTRAPILTPAQIDEDTL